MVIQRNLNKPESKTAKKVRLRKEKKIAKHSVQGKCDCLKQCTSKISDDRRDAINDALDPASQKLYIRSRAKPVGDRMVTVNDAFTTIFLAMKIRTMSMFVNSFSSRHLALKLTIIRF